MNEEPFYKDEFSHLPEHSPLPEHSALPEYNPVFPDISFFKESTVTAKEETISQGEPPAGEDRLASLREKRKERERYSLLQMLLGSALRAGAAVLCILAVVTAVSFGTNDKGNNAPVIVAAANSARRPAFTQQIGYSGDSLLRLWNRDPDAPHQYDMENPLITTEPTCIENGVKEYICTECGVHMHIEAAAAGHKAAPAVRENEIAATCQSEGSYTETVRCSVCGEELSHSVVTIARLDHTPAEPQIEDEVAPTCTEEGHYEEIIYCSVCGEELSRSTVTTAAAGHAPAAAVKEKNVTATCTGEGHYDSVVYCSVCKAELSRNRVTTAATGHTAKDPVKDWEYNTCLKGGKYYNVTYCKTCGKELSRSDAVIIAAEGHKFNTNPSNGDIITCSKCGANAVTAKISSTPNGTTVSYSIDESYLEALSKANKSIRFVETYSVTSKTITSQQDYTGSSGSIYAGNPSELPSGSKIRLRLMLSNKVYISTKTLTVP